MERDVRCRVCRAVCKSYAALRDHARGLHPDYFKAVQHWINPNELPDPAFDFGDLKHAAEPARFDAGAPAAEALKRSAIARRKG